MKVNKLLSIMVFLSGMFFVNTNTMAVSAVNCVSINTVRGTSCGSPDSMQVKVKNNCNQTVYVKVCIEKTNGDWSCGSDSGLEPGQTNGGFYTCHATRNYEYQACTGGYKECGFKK